jgi:hypothetical protein
MSDIDNIAKLAHVIVNMATCAGSVTVDPFVFESVNWKVLEEIIDGDCEQSDDVKLFSTYAVLYKLYESWWCDVQSRGNTESLMAHIENNKWRPSIKS